MIRFENSQQLTLPEFDWPLPGKLDETNRWVKLSELIPWEALSASYYRGLSKGQGRPAKPGRLVIGAVIIKHKLKLSDEETVEQIRENPYLQYFVGLAGYQTKAPFSPTLFVEIRKRMGAKVFDGFHQAIIDEVEVRTSRATAVSTVSSSDDSDQEPPGWSVTDAGGNDEEATPSLESPPVQGKLIVDATVADQAIRYPTDLSLLNEAREFTEQIIDRLWSKRSGPGDKPRTYRRQARQAYLSVAKQRRPGVRVRRRAIKRQLQYLRRNLTHIETLMAEYAPGQPIPLPAWLMRRYWVIPHLVDQQWSMYRENSRRCDDRIVSLSQPQVRPIVRGRLSKPVEFGAKLSVSLDAHGLAHVDQLRWEAYHEAGDLPEQVERYRQRYGYYPAVVLADQIYGTRANRRYLKARGIRFAGKALGRPSQNPSEHDRVQQQARRQEYRQRIPIEGKFGQGKGGYGLGYIRAKRADTSVAWIGSIFLVMNLNKLIKRFIFAPPFLYRLIAQWTRVRLSPLDSRYSRYANRHVDGLAWA